MIRVVFYVPALPIHSRVLRAMGIIDRADFAPVTPYLDTALLIGSSLVNADCDSSANEVIWHAQATDKRFRRRIWWAKQSVLGDRLTTFDRVIFCIPRCIIIPIAVFSLQHAVALDVLEPFLKPGARVLDVGCGMANT